MLFAAALSISLTASAPARSGSQNSQSKEPTGSISGRVMLGDKPAPRVAVLLTPSEFTPFSPRLPQATTDDDGHFQLTNVAAGNYLLQTFTPAFVASGSDFRGRPGKIINLSEGEAVEGVEIALTRGGVITGKITDAEGQPLIQENVRLTSVNERGQKQGVNLPYWFMLATDDRGVYRLFGVPAGRYIVSVGVDSKSGYLRPGIGNNYYSLTYHPDATDDSKATVIEVSAGGEAGGIDILVGRASKSYSATGRIVDDAGKPVTGLNLGYGSLQPDGTNFSSYFPSGAAANSKGEFRLEGIVPGRYAVFAFPIEQSDWYCDPVAFQVTDADVSGLEIKMHHGSSVSGVVSFDAPDQEGVPKLSELRLGVQIESESLTSPRSGQLNVGPDGSFRSAGLQPGKIRFYVEMYPVPKGLSMLRVERDGAEQPNGVEIRSGEQISGLKIVLGYGSGVIRGTVKVEGGTLPASSRLMVQCVRNDGANRQLRYIQPVFPDIRGRFAIEGLFPGEYALTAVAAVATGAGTPSQPKFARQTVSVNNGSETEVTLVIDLTENKQQ